MNGVVSQAGADTSTSWCLGGDPAGLWAVEPHLGRGDIGVMWEELLVIDDHDAHWLSDDVPHLRAATAEPPR